MLLFLCRLLSAGEEHWTTSCHRLEVPFNSWQAGETKTRTKILVLVPSYNGKGEQMIDERWKTFAAQNDLILLAPSFHAKGNENNLGKGYYYPEQGSGEVMVKALIELKRRTGVETDKVLFFGFSAGAHFVHRFALWKPQQVKAFVAHSAGWWSEPTSQLKNVPALILCGEADERYGVTWDFFKKGQRLGCPWVWRSYKQTGHELTPTVRLMAEVFLAHYALNEIQAKSTVARYGDTQTYRSVNLSDGETISEEFRIELPSPAVADVWEKE